jgi:hypothetical protein
MPECAPYCRLHWSGVEEAYWASFRPIGVSPGGHGIGTCICSICWRAIPPTGLSNDCFSSRLRRLARPPLQADGTGPRFGDRDHSSTEASCNAQVRGWVEFSCTPAFAALAESYRLPTSKHLYTAFGLA